MFDSLADQIRQDEKAQTNNRQEIIRWTAISVLMLLLVLGFWLAFKG
jgi:hypothetical protein